MANHTLTIKLQIEGLADLKKIATSGGTRGGGGAASGVGGGSSNVDIDDVRKAFSELAASVRAIKDTLESAATSIRGAAKVASEAPKAASGGAGSGAADDDAAKSEAAKKAATEQTTVANKEATDAMKAQAEAAAKAAEATGEISDFLDDFRKRWEGSTRAAHDAADSTDEIRKSLTELSSLSSGRANPAAIFSKVIRPIAKDTTLNEAAGKLRGNLDEFFTVPKGASDKVKAEAQKARVLLEGAIRQVVEGLSTGDIRHSTRGLISGLRHNIDSIVKEAALAGIKPIEANMKSLVDSLHATELINAINIVEKAFQRGQALKDAGQDFSSAMADVEAAVGNFNRVAGKVAARSGTGAIGAGANELISQTIGLAKSPLDLSPFQREIVESTQAAAGLKQPLELARDLFTALAKDMGNLESNLRQVNEGLKETTQGDVGNDQEAFKKIQELLGLTAIRRTSAGLVKGSNVAVGLPQDIFNRQRIADQRADIAKAGAGTTRSFDVFSTDQAGNIRKVHLELKQMGSTIDSVRVKAKELSNNMFDRASVRTALQRVATWGAAAGLVFGAINAFRQGVDTVVKTESSIVTLGKVMDEAQSHFESFKKEATSAAIGIAQEFGQPLEGVIQTMILFAQQGKNMKEVLSLTKASALASQVTTLDQPQAASALTAVTEQFGIDATNATSIIDKFNNVSNNAAVTETTLAEAVRRAGNSAKNAGVDFDQFNGIVAAISEQTRQGGSEIGNALRFIFARINSDEAEKGLSKVGVAVRDAAGNVKPFVQIVEELAGKFDGLTDSQKNQVAISVAGGHRFNTFLALVQNFGRFQDSLADSTNAAGSAMKEQQRVAETAAFKIQQLKNSVSATAISFGNVFLPALKGIVGIAGGLFDALNKIPDSLKLIGVAAAAAGIAFARFSDHAVAFMDLFDHRGGLVGGLTAPFGGSTTQGRDFDTQRNTNFAQFAKFEAQGGGRNVARQVGDFASTLGVSTIFKGGEAADKFGDKLKEANITLRDHKGVVVDAASGITKFTAATRGYTAESTDSFGNVTKSTLGLNALNSTFGKITGAVVKLSGAITDFSVFGVRLNPIGHAIRGMEFGVTKVAQGFGLAEKNAKALGFAVGNVLKVGGAFLILTVGLDLLGQLKDAVTRTGDSVKEGLSEEIAKRTEAVSKIAEQRKQMDSLARAQSKAANVSALAATEPSVLRDERIRQGTFKDPLLERQRLAAAQQRASNQIGFANPQLIDHVDEFGNAVLRSADAFDQLSASASSAQERILAALQTDVIEGFIEDLEPASGFKKLGGKVARGFGDVVDTGAKVLSLGFFDGPGLFEDTGKTARDKFEEEISDLEDLLNNPKLKAAQNLGIDISLIDEGFSEDLDKQTLAVEKAGLDITNTITKIRAEVGRIPSDSIEPLLKSGKFQDFAKLAARQLTANTGTPTTDAQFKRQLLLQNRSSFKGIGGLIGTSGEETVGNLNEKGILGKTLDLQKDLASQLKGGELAILKNFIGFDQAEVVVNEFGQVLLKSFDKQTGKITLKPLTDDLIKQINDKKGSIQLFDPKLVRQNIERSMLEITRVVSGGARGSLISSDLDLGVGRRFQASSQQLASIRDEPLTRDVLAATKALETFKETFKTPLEGSDVEAALNTDTNQRFSELSIDKDVVDTAFRFAAGVEEVGRSFEEAIDKLESDRITDTFKSQFSGILGAARGLVEDKTNVPLRQDQLNPEQIFAKFAPTLIQSASRLSQSEVATGESLAAGANLDRNIGLIVKELTGAKAAGGVRDPARLSQLAAEKFGAQGKSALDLQVAIADKSLHAQEEQVKLLQELVNKDITPEDTTGRLRAANEVFSAGGISKEDFAKQIDALSTKQLGAVSRSVLNQTQSNLGTLSPESLLDVLEKKNTEAISKTLSANLLKFDKEKDFSGKSLGDLFSGSAGRAFGEDFKSKQAESITSKELKDFITANRANLVAKPGGELAISDAQARSFGENIVDEFKKAGLGGAASEISKKLESGDSGILDEIKRTIRAGVTTTKATPAERIEEEKRDIVKEGKQRQDLLRAMRSATEATQKLKEPLLETASGFKSLGLAVAGAIAGIRDSINAAIAKIENSRFLGALGSNSQAGLLKGTRDVGFDPGKTKDQLSGRDLTVLGNQGLIQAGNDFQEVFNSSRTTLEELKNKEREIIAIRAEAAKSGNLQTVNAADNALKQIGGTFDFLRSQAENASGVISNLGDTINNLDAVNQLQVDISNLFKSFEKQKAGVFDTTSIDAALGRNLFSATRPTFEQFQQGQSGFLTKFERSIEDIRAQERSGQLSPQQAQEARGKATFERDEDVIALAQQRENKAFEGEVQFAEQLKDRLLDFSFSGAAAGGQARALADALKSELEQAGDLVPTSGSRSVRDPRTGRDINVPASKLLEFRGVRGLGDVEEKVKQIAAQVKNEEQQKNASLINQPIVDALNITRDSTLQKLEEVIAAINDNPANKSAENVQKVLDALGGKSQSIQDLASGTLDPAAEARAANDVAGALANINVPAADLAKGLETFKVSVHGVIESFAEFSKSNAALIEATTAGAAKLSSFWEAWKAGGSPPGKASGGLITGPGGPRSDRVPLMASNGEFVMRASAVSKIGLPLLMAMNAGRYAGGGLIDEEDIDFEKEEKLIREALQRKQRKQKRLRGEKLNLSPLETTEGPGLRPEDIRPFSRSAGAVSDSLLDEQQGGGTVDLTARLRQLETGRTVDLQAQRLGELADIKEKSHQHVLETARRESEKSIEQLFAEKATEFDQKLLPGIFSGDRTVDFVKEAAEKEKGSPQFRRAKALVNHLNKVMKSDAYTGYSSGAYEDELFTTEKELKPLVEKLLAQKDKTQREIELLSQLAPSGEYDGSPFQKKVLVARAEAPSALDQVLHDAGHGVVGIAKGAVKAGVGTVKSIAHPIQTVEALGHAALHPIDTAGAIGDSLLKTIKSGDPEAIGELFGSAEFTIGSGGAAAAAKTALAGGRAAPVLAAVKKALKGRPALAEKVVEEAVATAAKEGIFKRLLKGPKKLTGKGALIGGLATGAHVAGLSTGASLALASGLVLGKGALGLAKKIPGLAKGAAGLSETIVGKLAKSSRLRKLGVNVNDIVDGEFLRSGRNLSPGSTINPLDLVGRKTAARGAVGTLDPAFASNPADIARTIKNLEREALGLGSPQAASLGPLSGPARKANLLGPTRGAGTSLASPRRGGPLSNLLLAAKIKFGGPLEAGAKNLAGNKFKSHAPVRSFEQPELLPHQIKAATLAAEARRLGLPPEQLRLNLGDAVSPRQPKGRSFAKLEAEKQRLLDSVRQNQLSLNFNPDKAGEFAAKKFTEGRTARGRFEPSTKARGLKLDEKFFKEARREINSKGLQSVLGEIDNNINLPFAQKDALNNFIEKSTGLKNFTELMSEAGTPVRPEAILRARTDKFFRQEFINEAKKLKLGKEAFISAKLEKIVPKLRGKLGLEDVPGAEEIAETTAFNNAVGKAHAGWLSNLKTWNPRLFQGGGASDRFPTVPFDEIPSGGSLAQSSVLGREGAVIDRTRLATPPENLDRIILNRAKTLPEFLTEEQLEDLLKRKRLIPERFASGGSIFGPGGSMGDRVPILASNGEFIMNSDTVKKIGAPILNHINKTGSIPFGALPKFAEGGLVSSDRGGASTTAVEIKVDTDAISAAIRSAVSEAFDGVNVPLNSEQAANDISSALASALANIQLPEIQVNTENISVPLDIPDRGLPIDVSAFAGLNLGENLGAGVRNRLEAVEGSVSSLRDDTNGILDSLEGVDFETLLALPAEISEVKSQVEVFPDEIARLEENAAAQKIEILNEVFTMINEQLSNIQNDDAIVARLDKHIAATDSSLNQLSNNIAQAVSLATRALSQALARV